jgi:hypothetical protein
MLSIGQKIGLLEVVGIRKFKNSRGETKPVALCKCDCGKRIERDHKSLQNSNRKKCKSSCGCLDKQAVAQEARKERKSVLDIVLTRQELEQVERIVSERTGRRLASNGYTDREDAIACVIADRRVNEMVCHGGKVRSL